MGLVSDVGVVKSFNFWSPSLKKLGLYKVGEIKFSYEEIFPTFPNLTHLEVEIKGTTWRLLLAILKSSPNLEVLIIQNQKVRIWSTLN